MLKGLKMICTHACNPEKTKVVLLKGGKSGEREISLLSGTECARALREKGFEVTEIDTVENNLIDKIKNAKPDVIYIALHGRDGEDGCVQGVCEILNIPYTGSGVLASALAMDKSKAKLLYTASNLPTPPSQTLYQGNNTFAIEDIINKIGNKCVVKPANEGSALGVSIVNTASELKNAIENAFKFDTEILVERFVEGTEVTVAILGNDNLEALPVIEIVPQDTSEFYDFEAKYAAGGSTHIIPARLSDEQIKECQRIALAAHKALGCRGVSRSDLIVDNAGICWLLETNTIPGMTETSLLPDAARKIGIEFNDLCTLLVNLALEDK